MNILKVIIVLCYLLITNVYCIDFCELEKNSCDNNTHVGCFENEFNGYIYDWVLPDYGYLKIFFNKKVNQYRSDLAMGKFADLGFPKAANMRSMRWSEHYSELAALVILRVPANETACVHTEEMNDSLDSFLVNNEYDDFYYGNKNYLVNALTNQIVNKTVMSRFVHANNYLLGGAQGIYLDLIQFSYIINIKLVQNEWKSKTVAEYEVGEPCSKCSMWNEVCSGLTENDTFPGLCVPKENVISGPTSIIGSTQSVSNCLPTITTVSNGVEICKDQLIFEDNFDTLNNDIWKPEIKIPLESEDAEFVSYQNLPENCFIKDGELVILPKLLTDFIGYDENRLRTGELDLNPHCTGTTNPELECIRNAGGQFILPPIVSCKLTTKSSFSFKYGKVEVRAKFPQGDWIIPQLYLEPLDRAYGSIGFASGLMRIGFIRGNDMLEYGDNIQIDGYRLSGGLILSSKEELRNIWLKSTLNNNHLGSDYHTYTLIWTNEVISIAVDNIIYANYRSNFKSQAKAHNVQHASLWDDGDVMAPFDKEFYLSLGVAAGGLSDFPDLSRNGHLQTLKPWNNTSPKSETTFWLNKHSWHPTWRGLNAAMKVDYVKVWAV